MLKEKKEVKKRPKNPRKCVIENYNEDFSEGDDLSSDDEHLYCDDCNEEYKGACPTHGQMTLILDREAPKDDPDRAKATLPHFFSLETSSIPNSGIGVWSKIPLPRGIVFGPYEGIVKFEREAAISGYAWKVETSTDSLYIDAENPSKSNWMRFVNCAPQIEHEQQNLAAFQFRRQVYYKTIKPVLPDTELLVWYGDDYAEDLGMSKAQVKEILPKVPKRFQCKFCGALFSESSALKRHRKWYPHRSRRGRFRCEQCFYSTNQSQSFKNHLRTHSDERPYKCEHCNKAFATEAYLKSHTRIHTGERPYACEHCNKAFAKKANLERHNRIHTGERPYVCCTCDKAFRQSNHLHVHERTHSKERPKVSSDTCDCWYCVLGRKEDKKKNSHESIHTQQKQFKCTHCDYKGILRHQINLHVARIHTKEYKFRCSICNSGFRDKKDLESHCQRVGSTACMAMNISEDPSMKNGTDG